MTGNAVATTFAAAMDWFAPFESAPHLAVAASGGADSLSLCLLARDWAAARGGRVTALTVDHGLRPASEAEVAEVGAWMARYAIEHRVLRWRGEKPTTALQEKARVARYRLLCGWCRDNAVLHLLLGHNADDQAETVLQRLIRGSGTDGLAGMSALVETAEVRLLRPLLGCRAIDLRCFLRQRGEDWIEDPSNRDPRFFRTRLRASWPALEAAGLGRHTLLTAAERMAEARAAMQDAVITLLAKCCRVHPMGFARLDRAVMAAAPVEIAVKALARVVMMIGGSARECAAEQVRRSYERLLGADCRGSATLGRCLLVVRRSELLVCREQRNLPAPRIVLPQEEILWDGRFLLRIMSLERTASPWHVRPMQKEEWRILRANSANLLERSTVPLVRGTLPVLCDKHDLAIAPHFAYVRPDLVGMQSLAVEIRWRPRVSITGAGYSIL
jgi:tRNA(Ile)-lysidine synthase